MNLNILFLIKQNTSFNAPSLSTHFREKCRTPLRCPTFDNGLSGMGKLNVQHLLSVYPDMEKEMIHQNEDLIQRVPWAEKLPKKSGD